MGLRETVTTELIRQSLTQHRTTNAQLEDTNEYLAALNQKVDDLVGVIRWMAEQQHLERTTGKE